MYKDFDRWNILKKKIEVRNSIYTHKREIWWCYLGINVGSEICGKNEIFERPVLIVKVFNKDVALVIPLTTKNKGVVNHIKLSVTNVDSFAMIEHMKTISTKRLSRKITKLDPKEFLNFENDYFTLLCNRKPAM
ncbi:MAG: hypothetical protein RJB39_677 [Candidatus Parcubacteria bacterium]|jgi:mRNA interferase MazF